VAQEEDNIIAEGVQVIWVLEFNQSFVPGTALDCRNFVDGQGSDKGLCAGDGETQPTAGIFDSSPFSVGRGIDMLVRRADMEIVFAAAHGTPGGNDNYTGQELLGFIQMQKILDEESQ
jgi:hypothetical protein